MDFCAEKSNPHGALGIFMVTWWSVSLSLFQLTQTNEKVPLNNANEVKCVHFYVTDSTKLMIANARSLGENPKLMIAMATVSTCKQIIIDFRSILVDTRIIHSCHYEIEHQREKERKRERMEMRRIFHIFGINIMRYWLLIKVLLCHRIAVSMSVCDKYESDRWECCWLNNICL